MKNNNNHNYLFDNVETIKGIGKKLSTYLKKKKIEKINDLLWNLPYSSTDQSASTTLDKLEIGKIFTLKIKVIKYNFPRIRNLPNKIKCKDEHGEIDLVFFNSREGYIRKILPLNEWVVVSGKINYFKNRYQITNPNYVTTLDKIDYVQSVIPKYSLTEGISEKVYRKIIQTILDEIPSIDEWHDKKILEKMNFLSWKESLDNLHNPNNELNINSNNYRRLVYDEIFANFLFLSKNRNKIKKIKKNTKSFSLDYSEKIINSLPFKLTDGQKRIINEINKDLMSSQRMFRILQGDVGSGKTIIAFLAAINVINAGYQCALMVPTSILAEQHSKLFQKLLQESKLNIKFDLLTSKIDKTKRKQLLKDLQNNKINFLIGTHALFQKTINFKKLGLVIIDEQHKFGVRQRINFAKKGERNCDLLLMSATPIPRTMMMSIYGDMDTSKLTDKPLERKKILTLSKPEDKIDDLWPFIKNKINAREQVFWVCPLIEDSSKLDYSSTKKTFDLLEKKFPNKIAIIHGALDNEEKEKILKKFLNNEISILVSTTVIEVGIDFPNANTIVIENANKFGLAQLHQLRGRVGRGSKEGTCILLFKNQLSQNAKKRIQILKSSNDGFFIAEEDMKLRGYGDLIGFKQSGLKLFKLADPVQHEDLFNLAQENVEKMSNEELNHPKYDLLLKLFDKVDLIDEEKISA
ncbi:MAG: ATP-dependent DNA helicase RecG [Pelagibacteraceae bacterium]